MTIRTNTDEFYAFYALLMESAPTDYTPFLFPLEQNGKDPLSSRGSWTAEKNRLNANEAARFLEHGFNIGISARDYDPLVLVDIDDTVSIPVSEVKPTLSVITRSRVGTHNFYYTDDPKCIVNIPTDYGEIRSANQYLVVCGSYVTTCTDTLPHWKKDRAGQYSILNRVPPASITFDELPKVFRDQHNSIIDQPYVSSNVGNTTQSKSALFRLTIDDVISYPKNKSRFASVLHGSASGANSAVSEGRHHCWRHLVYHTPIQLLAVFAGVYTCQQAGNSHGNGGAGASMLDYRDGETMFRIWDFARRSGYIPPDDHPPSVVILWAALAMGVCTQQDVIDGWKLPTFAYIETIELLNAMTRHMTGAH